MKPRRDPEYRRWALILIVGIIAVAMFVKGLLELNLSVVGSLLGVAVAFAVVVGLVAFADVASRRMGR